MTTGESLVSIWRNNITLEQEKAAAIDAAIAEAKREAQPARCERHKCVVTSLNSICEICDHEEAVAEAVSKTRVECAGICLTKHFASDAARDILALDAPPAPAYPFGLDRSGKQCACWKTTGSEWQRPVGVGHGVLQPCANFCEVCGAPRKGS